jgi:hypothetical protein
MKYIIPFLIISFCFLSISAVNAQSQDLIDSLVSTSKNKVIVFKTNCSGCVVLNEPCQDYIKNGNPWNLYVVWKNNDGFHIKKFNGCGSSDILTLRKWKTDPFDILNSNANEIDTTELKYSLTFSPKDSTWYETGINHYKYYELSFPSYGVRNLMIKDYAFREPIKDAELFIGNEDELRMNEKRYTFNNKSSVKKLLDSLLSTIEKKQKKLEIKE